MPYIPPVYSRVCANDRCNQPFDTYYETAKYCCSHCREAAAKRRARQASHRRVGSYEGSQAKEGFPPARSIETTRREIAWLNSPDGKEYRARLSAIAVRKGEVHIGDCDLDILPRVKQLVEEANTGKIIEIGTPGTPNAISEAQDEAERVLHELGYGSKPKPPEPVPTLPPRPSRELNAPLPPDYGEVLDTPPSPGNPSRFTD